MYWTSKIRESESWSPKYLESIRLKKIAWLPALPRLLFFKHRERGGGGGGRGGRENSAKAAVCFLLHTDTHENKNDLTLDSRLERWIGFYPYFSYMTDRLMFSYCAYSVFNIFQSGEMLNLLHRETDVNPVTNHISPLAVWLKLISLGWGFVRELSCPLG